MGEWVNGSPFWASDRVTSRVAALLTTNGGWVRALVAGTLQLMQAFLISDGGLDYRVTADTTEAAVWVWAKAVLGGSVAIGRGGASQFLVLQADPVGAHASVVVEARPIAVEPVVEPRRRRKARVGRPSRLFVAA